MFDIKPIRSKQDHDDAMAEVDRLLGSPLGTPEGERLDVLATLIEAYEAKSFPMDIPDLVEALKFRMEQQGLTNKDLEPMLGPRSHVSEVLSRKRGLSIAMIRKVHSGLFIPAEFLIRPSQKHIISQSASKLARKKICA